MFGANKRDVKQISGTLFLMSSMLFFAFKFYASENEKKNHAVRIDYETHINNNYIIYLYNSQSLSITY